MGSNVSSTVAGFWHSNGALRKGLVLLLVVALLETTASAAFGQASSAPDPSLVMAQVKKFGIGKSVKVTLVGGEKLRGHIGSIGGESFTVKLAKSGGERPIPYAQVAEIKDPSPLFWILIGAALVIVVIVAAKH